MKDSIRKFIREQIKSLAEAVINEFDKFENIDFDVKSINMVYTDSGRFYGFNIYSEPGLKGKRVKLSYTEEINKFLQSKEIQTEIPVGYDEDILDSIVADLEKQGIEAEHHDYMDVSEGNLNETYTVGKKVTYLGHPAVITAVKEYNGKTYYSVSYDKGSGKTKASDVLSTDGTIKPLEESKSKSDEFRKKVKDYLAKKDKNLKEMASELGYMNEETSEETGLMVIPRTSQDANKIYAYLDDSNWTADWNSAEGYFLFPEEEDMYDSLEAEIEEFLVDIGVNARIEGVFNENKQININEAVYTDPNTGKSYDLQFVSSKNRWELDIMKKGASIYSSAITTIKRKTVEEIIDWLEGYNIDSSWVKKSL